MRIRVMGLSFIGGDTWETYQTGMILVYFIMHHVTVHLKVYDIYLYIATTKLTAMIYLKYC
jgi:hypothetical protein